MMWVIVVLPAATAIGLLTHTPLWTEVALAVILCMAAVAGLLFTVRRWGDPPWWAAMLAKCDSIEYRGRRPRPILRSSRPGWRNPFDYTGDDPPK